MLTEEKAKSVMKERGYEYLSYMQQGKEENKTLNFIKHFNGSFTLNAKVKLNSNSIYLSFVDLQYLCQLTLDGLAFDHLDFEKFENTIIIYAAKCMDVDVFTLLGGLKKVKVVTEKTDPEEDLAKRRRKFWDKIVELGKEKKYTKELCLEFYNYWISKNEQGKRMRFEMEKVFDIPRRLVTWISHDKKWSKTFIEVKIEKQNKETGKTKTVNTKDLF